MRRKLSPAPLARAFDSRPLRPVAFGSLLPTAALLMSLGCSAPTVDVVASDPVTKPTVVTQPAPAPSPYLEPDPHELDGDVAVVKPAPSATPPKTAGGPH